MIPWLHPSLVHFAIGLLFGALVFDVVGLWRTNERLVLAGYWNTLLGAAAALLAAATGFYGESRLGPHSALGDALLEFHKIFGVSVAILSLVLAGARVAMRGYILPRFRTLYLAVGFLMTSLVLIGGALGGVMVYRFGVGISPEAAARVMEANQAEAVKPEPAAKAE